MFQGFDKILHLSFFAILGFLFRGSFPRFSLLSFTIIMLIYALMTEIFQELMALGRSMELLDLLADMLGVYIGALLVKFLKNK